MDGIYRKVRRWVLLPRFLFLRYVFGFKIDRTTIVSFGSVLDRSNPKGVHIGKNSIITTGAIILSHDFVTSTRSETHIGDNCFIGVGSIVMPGVRIGDGSVVGAGSIVTKDIPPGSLAVGNPAQVIRSIKVGHYGKMIRQDYFKK